MMQSKEFSNDELESILGQAVRLTQRGYFTGMNFVAADQPLPTSSIVIHFLHDSAQQIEHVQKASGVSGLVIPRFSIYRMDPKYFDKPEFREEYKDATFYDRYFKPTSMQEAIIQKQDVIVAHPELDLLVPLHAENLEKTVTVLCGADTIGPAPWEDPVVIIRSTAKLLSLSGFVPDLHFAAITGVNEEFYTVLADEQRFKGLQKYLKLTCAQGHCPGKLNEGAIVFSPSQVNHEFFSYMLKNLKPFAAE